MSSRKIGCCLRLGVLSALAVTLVLAAPSEASAREAWIGTAPFCKGKPSDCTRRGMVYVRRSRRGTGRKCWSGYKVLCRSKTTARRPAAKAQRRPARTTGGQYFHTWIGTAPSCRGKPSDCTRRGWTYVRRSRRGDGSKCWSGYKVLCRGKRAVIDRQKFDYFWVGTKPFCAGAAKDCVTRGMTYVKTEKRGCTSGHKVLCAAPKIDTRKYFYRWFGTAPKCEATWKDCTKRQMLPNRRNRTGDGSRCLSGYKQLCYTKRLPALRRVPPSTRRNFRLLAWNLYLRPVAYLKNGQLIRAKLIPRYVRDYDAIIISEAFDEISWATLWNGLRRVGYRYKTGIVGHVNVLKGRMWNGGVVIVSKFPIEQSKEKTFSSLCKEDCNAHKGVMYARINKYGRRYHVFGSHTESTWKPHAIAMRKRQFQMIQRFIQSLRIPRSEMVLIGGDLNVDKWHCDRNRNNCRISDEYKQMKQLLHAEDPPRVLGHDRTYDPRHNRLITQEGQTRSEYLDYVLYSTDHRRPDLGKSYVECRPLKSRERWKEYFWETKQNELSDHYSVLGYYEY